MKHVHKNSGNIETFNSKKLHASVYKTAVSNQISDGKAKIMADEVTQNIVSWLSKKTEVTYLDLRKQVSKQIAVFDTNIALLYEKHKDLW